MLEAGRGLAMGIQWGVGLVGDERGVRPTHQFGVAVKCAPVCAPLPLRLPPLDTSRQVLYTHWGLKAIPSYRGLLLIFFNM